MGRKKTTVSVDETTGQQVIIEEELPDEPAAEKPLSAARARLARARAGRLDEGQNLFEPLVLADGDGGEETFYVRRLKLSQVTRVHLEASQDGAGALNLEENDDDLRAYTIAVLEACIHEKPEEGCKYFANLDEAAEWVDSFDEDIQRTARSMRDASIALSPLLVPNSLRGRAIPLPRLNLPLSQETSELGSNSTSTSGATSGKETGSGDEEPPSPSD